MDRQIGKTAIIIDTMLYQNKLDDNLSDSIKSFTLITKIKTLIYIVFTLVLDKKINNYQNLYILEKNNAMDFCVLVAATALMQHLYSSLHLTRCSIGEYFRDNGMHAVIFYDDLSKQAVAYRQMSYF